MITLSGTSKHTDATLFEVLSRNEGSRVNVHGMVHNLRDFGEVKFMLLRMPRGILQCVLSADVTPPREGDALRVGGLTHFDERAPQGVELLVDSLDVLSSPAEPLPIPLGKYKLNLALDTELSLRPVALRHVKRRAIFKLQEGIVRGFTEQLRSDGFTQIHSPKIVATGAEGGANIFKLDYFGKKAYLAQSPQFYKQTLVGVYERVFEVGPVFRAEKHNTTRHLNEYISMDFEMGFIDSFEDVMEQEVRVLQNVMRVLEADYAHELKLLAVNLPDVSHIPTIRFDDAKRAVAERYHRAIRDPFDLEPEEEQLISRMIYEDTGCEFVFVTHYPSKKRPFYAMDDPADTRYTLSFDLLMRGMEVTTGGQRIHDYAQQIQKIKHKGLDPAEFESYTVIHKAGMPPHGGLGLGLERLTMKLIGEHNVRSACMFPRDTLRLEP